MQRKLFRSTRETTLRETESVQHGDGERVAHTTKVITVVVAQLL